MIASNLPRSAEVELWLHCGGKRYELGQVGGNFAILAKNETLEGGEAIVETIIDGRSDRFPVEFIPDPSGESRRLQFVPEQS
ncbi:hypothetical protein [Rhodopirellula europaea]|uniref:Uncharacterized protein n=1 Tax=Rhodopirellula europaea 6C TaxID=1263867 RepID=M2ABG1_9BACT|nr:hypothetical protein [Rhodopirellula europaea]EMB14045.1 hypothetical protein RE6C_05218 [Rhodopirellula europaea 6C]